MKDTGPLVVVDVETTDGDPLVARIIEVAAIRLEADRSVLFHSLVRPGVPIPPFARMLTGIRESDVREAPTFAMLAPELQRFLSNAIVVAHNIRFDMTVLEQEFRRTHRSFAAPTLCTERLSRQLLPGLKHHNLASLCRHFGIRTTGLHRALQDARATAALLEELLLASGHDRISERLDRWPRQARA